MIFNHESPEYQEVHRTLGRDKNNGAYWYSYEICKNIIPNVKTSRNWVTINVTGNCWDHSIFFVHNNLYPDIYSWVSDFNDMVLVCSNPSTVDKVKDYGKAIYLPLSIDTEYVKQFQRPKDKDICYFGRQEKRMFIDLGRRVTTLENMPRDKILPEVARYKKAFAIGRCALEAKLLGCEILPFDSRYPDPSIWEVLDNKDAAKLLQMELDRIDNQS